MNIHAFSVGTWIYLEAVSVLPAVKCAVYQRQQAQEA